MRNKAVNAPALIPMYSRTWSSMPSSSIAFRKPAWAIPRMPPPQRAMRRGGMRETLGGPLVVDVTEERDDPSPALGAERSV